MEHTDSVRCLLLLTHGSELLSGSGDKTIKMWDVKTGKRLKTLIGHASSVECLLLLPIKGELVSSSYDKTIKIWDLVVGQCLRTINGHTDWVLCFLLLPNANEKQEDCLLYTSPSPRDS